MTKRHRKALINMNENLSRVSFKSRNRLYTLLYHAFLNEKHFTEIENSSNHLTNADRSHFFYFFVLNSLRAEKLFGKLKESLYF